MAEGRHPVSAADVASFQWPAIYAARHTPTVPADLLYRRPELAGITAVGAALVEQAVAS